MPIINNKSKQKWYGIPREEIAWSPEIDYKKCIGCGLCVLECPTHIFRYDFRKHIAEIIKPLKCKIGCTTCANLCPVKAVKLPSLTYLHEIMQKNDILGLSWDKLKYNKYMYM